MLDEALDLVYNPFFWYALNAVLLFALVMIVRMIRRTREGTVVESENGDSYEELLKTIRSEKEQGDWLKELSLALVRFVKDVTGSEIEKGSTLKEVLDDLLAKGLVKSSDLSFYQLYERGRFGGKSLSSEERELLRKEVMKLAERLRIASQRAQALQQPSS